MFSERASNKTWYDEISTIGIWSAGTYLSSLTPGVQQTNSHINIDATAWYLSTEDGKL